jgi:hypothetical protein
MANPRLIGAAVVSCLLILSSGPAMAAPGRAAALADLVVDETVDGDVVTIGGDVVLGPGADVHGHVVAMYGRVQRDPAARVDGRVIAVSSLSGLQLEQPDGSVQTAVRVLVAGCWLLTTTIIGFLLPGRVRLGVWLVRSVGAKMLVLGVLVYITLFAALVAVVGLGPTLGVPLFMTLALAFELVKALGLAVLGAWLGGALLHRVTDRSVPITVHVFLGVAAMLAARMVPVVGGVAWTALSVVALGAAVFTVAMAPGRGAVHPARTAGAPRN